MFMVIVNQIEESQETKNPIKIAYKKKGGKRKSNKKNCMILLCHRFDNKGRRGKCGNLQRKKQQKQKNLNPEREGWI